MTKSIRPVFLWQLEDVLRTMVGRLKSELSQAQDTIAKLQAIASVGFDGVAWTLRRCKIAGVDGKVRSNSEWT